METTEKCKLCGNEFDSEDSYLTHKRNGYCTSRCYEYDFMRQVIQLGIEEKGFRHERVNYKDNFNPEQPNFENVFFEVWRDENKVRPGLNYGNGTLQDLFMEDARTPFNGSECRLYIEPRDRFIVATVIQWLGSNCGMGFLHSVFNKIGYVLIHKRNNEQYIVPKPNITMKQINDKIDQIIDDNPNINSDPKEVAFAIARWILTY